MQHSKMNEILKLALNSHTTSFSKFGFITSVDSHYPRDFNHFAKFCQRSEKTIWRRKNHFRALFPREESLDHARALFIAK